MKTQRLEVDDGHRTHDHGEIHLFTSEPHCLEAIVKVEATLVIAPENFEEFKKDLEKVIAKFAL